LKFFDGENLHIGFLVPPSKVAQKITSNDIRAIFSFTECRKISWLARHLYNCLEAAFFDIQLMQFQWNAPRAQRYLAKKLISSV
jgi:hypothetical protein